MPVYWEASGLRTCGASKAHLPPCEVRESTRWADPVPNAPERVPTLGSPYAVLQAVVIHRQGVGTMRRVVSFAGLPD